MNTQGAHTTYNLLTLIVFLTEASESVHWLQTAADVRTDPLSQAETEADTTTKREYEMKNKQLH